MIGIRRLIKAALAYRHAELAQRLDAPLELLTELRDAASALSPAVGDSLNTALFHHVMYKMGLTDELDPNEVAKLEAADLLDLVAASMCVRAREEATPAEPGKGRTITTICDDRLVAALYTGYHYPGPDHDPDELVPDDAIAITKHTGVFVVGMQ